jgi:isochorismate synthase EntC
MQDKFDSALTWAQTAKEYLEKTNQKSDSKKVVLTNTYISELEQRIQNNRLLDLQWGKE